MLDALDEQPRELFCFAHVAHDQLVDAHLVGWVDVLVELDEFSPEHGIEIAPLHDGTVERRQV